MPIIPHNPRLSNGQQLRSLPSGRETSKDRTMYIRDRTGDRHSVMAALAVSKYFVISRRMVGADMSTLVDFGSRSSQPSTTMPIDKPKERGEKLIYLEPWGENHP